MLISCKYDGENKEKGTPWQCIDEDKKFKPAKNVLTSYPETMKIYNERIELKLDDTASCEFIESNKSIECGDVKTLKLSEDAEIIALKKPASLQESLFFVEENKMNPKLWANHITIPAEASLDKEFIFKMKVNEAVFEDEELGWFKEKNPMLFLDAINYEVSLHKPAILKGLASFRKEFENLDFEKVTISKEYQKKWGLFEALREWFANAHDVTEEDEETRITMEGNDLIIEYDSKIPLELKHLVVLGTHEKKKKLTIGMFGEGITLGSLVFARLGIPVKIESIGRTYYPELKHDDALDSTLLHIYHKKNRRKAGTKLILKGVPSEVVEEAKQTFLFNRADYEVIHENEYGKILEFKDGSSKIAIRDLILTGKQSKSLKSLFSYNFIDKYETLLNRDRDIVNEYSAKSEMCNVLEDLDKKPLINKIFEAYDDGEPYADLMYNIHLTSSVEVIWITALHDFLRRRYGGRPIAVMTGIEWADTNVKHMGYDLIDWGDGNYLLERLGVLKSTEVPGAEGKPRVIKLEELSSDEQFVFHKSKNNLAAILKDYYHEEEPYRELNKIYVAESFRDTKEEHLDNNIEPLRGMVRGGKIYIHRNVLKNPAISTGTFIHEITHRYKGREDITRAFENELTGIAGFTTNEWQNNRNLFNKSLDALSDAYDYRNSPTFRDEHPDIASYFGGA